MYGKLIVSYCQDNHITYKEFAKLRQDTEGDVNASKENNSR